MTDGQTQINHLFAADTNSVPYPVKKDGFVLIRLNLCFAQVGARGENASV